MDLASQEQLRDHLMNLGLLSGHSCSQALYFTVHKRVLICSHRNLKGKFTMLDISVHLTKIQRFQISRNLLYCLFLTSLCLICGVEYTEFSLFSLFFPSKSQVLMKDTP